jgi:hypothetical protein
MEDRETPRIHKYGGNKTTRIMITTLRHVTAWAGRKKLQASWFLLNRVYLQYNGFLSASVDYFFQQITSKEKR